MRTQSLVILHSKMAKCKMAWSEKFIAMGYIFLGEFENGFAISDYNPLMASSFATETQDGDLWSHLNIKAAT